MKQFNNKAHLTRCLASLSQTQNHIRQLGPLIITHRQSNLFLWKSYTFNIFTTLSFTALESIKAYAKSKNNFLNSRNTLLGSLCWRQTLALQQLWNAAATVGTTLKMTLKSIWHIGNLPQHKIRAFDSSTYCLLLKEMTMLLHSKSSMIVKLHYFRDPSWAVKSQKGSIQSPHKPMSQCNASQVNWSSLLKVA